MCHWPLTPYVCRMNVRASQVSLQWRVPSQVGLQSMWTWPSKQWPCCSCWQESWNHSDASLSRARESPKSAQKTCCIEVIFSTALAVLIPKEGWYQKLCLATLTHNTIYFLIPLDFETALIHTKWSKTQMRSISNPKTLQLHITE